MPTRAEIAPYPSDGAIECWIGGDTDAKHQDERDAAHADFWRVAEGLLHAAYLSKRLNATTVAFAAHYAGVKGRRLTHWDRIDYIDWAPGISRDDDIRLSVEVAAESIEASLTEIVKTLLSPFYERFDFTRLPTEVVQREVGRLRKRSV